jgi:NAD(P)-dependent dehydrogenase (short-subunit alcohol dehydrogenase family)
MANLSGKTALVTGASRGIGRATAKALSVAGARVIVHYGQAKAEADSLVADLRTAGGLADAVGADMAIADGPHTLAARIRDLVGDRLDVLVANAGISKAATVENTTVADFDRLFAVNVRAPFFLVQQLLPALGEGSSVVFVTSVVARAVVGDLTAYAATKGALDTMVLHLASALGPRGVRVNAVAPGIIGTDMSNFAHTEEGRQYALGIQTIKRIARPEDVAGAVVFLASEDARWITGDTLRVDGGSKL